MMKSLLMTILLTVYAYSDISIFISHNNQLSTVNKKDLANLFLKKTNSINGIKLIPVDNDNQKLFREFYRKVVKKTPEQLHAYWVKQLYRGNVRPPKRLSTLALKKAMKNNTKIISYGEDPNTGRLLLTIR